MRVKAKKVNKLTNTCDCGEKIVLKKALWLKEAENMFNMFTDRTYDQLLEKKRVKEYKITGEHKVRIFFISKCKCGNVFYNDRNSIL